MRFFILLFFPLSLFANSLDSYFTLLEKYPHLFSPQGSYKQKEIEIVLQKEEIKKIEQTAKERLIKKGIPPEKALEWSKIGVICEDNYLYWLRDAVIFPSGVTGTYDRIMWKTNLTPPAGAAVLPILPNRKIVLNINFRHATRSWELEMPRGLSEKNETAIQTAKREATEETGYEMEELVYLGTLTPDNGILASQVPVFLANAASKVQKEEDPTEAILNNPSFTLEELKMLFKKGSYETVIEGKKQTVYVRDSFLAYALLLYEAI